MVMVHRWRWSPGQYAQIDGKAPKAVALPSFSP